ncbi:branched-chain-amino-acid aminotransferase-like protein 2 [Nematostella vectensis]|nr:branched-chain-amino-acid aminotransferase-like protein 2 [Nematostella vectensis]
MASKRVLLWTAPRCVSTAFERSIMTLKSTKVLHEPFSASFYFGPERQSLRYAADPVQPNQSYRSVSKTLQKDFDGIDVLFSKDMAYAVQNHFKMFSEEGFKDFKHTFLIREPAKAIISLYHASTNPKLTGWSYFDPEEAGFRQMLGLYHYISQHIDDSPVVIDADDLLDFPNETMKSYCEAVGITYESNMTSWEPGPVADWDTWAGWHENALKSSGFTRRSHRNTQKNSYDDEIEQLPAEVKMAIDEARACFEYLAARKLDVRGTEV